MNLILTRNKFCLYGIFGELKDESGKLLAVTLEHAYAQPDQSYAPKLPAGTYTCIRGRGPLNGLWKLESGRIIDTYQVMDVPPFMGAPVKDILIHPLNWNKESNGCIGVGLELGTQCILESEKAFEAFMATQSGVDSFLLVVA